MRYEQPQGAFVEDEGRPEIKNAALAARQIGPVGPFGFFGVGALRRRGGSEILTP